MIALDFQIVGFILILIGLIMSIGTFLLTFLIDLLSGFNLNISLWHDIEPAKKLSFKIFGVIIVIIGFFLVAKSEELATYLL